MGFEIVTGEPEFLALAYRQNGLDVAFLVGGETAEPAAARWRARLGWYARGGMRLPKPPAPAPLVLPPRELALHEAAAGALRAAGRPFVIVCASADFAVRSAAVSAGLGFAPMIDGLAPEGLALSVEADLPALPPLEILLVARGKRSPQTSGCGLRKPSPRFSSCEPGGPTQFVTNRHPSHPLAQGKLAPDELLNARVRPCVNRRGSGATPPRGNQGRAPTTSGGSFSFFSSS